MNKPGKSSLFRASLLVAVMGTALGVKAAGLGKLSVYSAIGQPLNAEVALTATPEELGSMSARLATQEAFKEAGIEFSPVLTGLRMSIAKSASGQPILRLTTEEPLNEPFLHFLIELNWASGRMVREYTFLLDPPELLKGAQPASVARPVVPASELLPSSEQPTAKARALEQPVTPSEAQAPKPVESRATVESKAGVKTPAAETGKEILVKPGDTLSKIARQHLPEAVTTDQMLVALFSTNREAFVGNNMNRLRAGRILRLPDPAQVAQIDPGEARRLIVSQAVDFNAYKRRLAATAAAAPVAQSVSPQQVTGKIKPKVEEKAPPVAAQDKLEVSRSEIPKAGKADASKSAIEEERIAREKALREAQERIAMLEKNLENLKRLVELKSESGAKIQQQAQVAVPPPAKVADEKKAEPSPPKVTEPAAPAAQAVVPAAEPRPAAEKPAELPSAVSKAPAPPSTPAAKKPVAPPPQQVAEASFIDENPELVFGGGGLIALLLGYLGYSAWRRRKQAQEARAEMAEASPSGMPHEVAKPSAPGSVLSTSDTSANEPDEVSSLGDFSSTEGALAAEVDPVAEAGVLMACGRDAQAEEILLEGLKTDPRHVGIHAKLLELYAKRQDKEKFESVAKGLHDITQGQGEAWSNALKLAVGLGMSGGVFAASAAVAPSSEKTTAVTAAPAFHEEIKTEQSVTPQPVVAAKSDEAVSLDFDLDLGPGQAESVAVPFAETAGPPATGEEIPEEPASREFDFDLGTHESEQAFEAAPAETRTVEVLPASTEPEEGNLSDFELDIGDSSASPAEQGKEVSPSREEGPALDFDLDLDLGSIEPETEKAASHPEPALTLPDISLDLEEPATTGQEALAKIDLDLDLDLGEPQVKPGTEAEPQHETLSESQPGIELKLQPGTRAEPQSGTAAEAQEASFEASLAGKTSTETETATQEATQDAAQNVTQADDPEVAIKLELAQAYEEMGDLEGARELLNEILNEGSPAQQQEAQSRLARLST